MYFAALLVAVLLALHGLAADSASTSTIPCLTANTTLLVTKTLTVSFPKITLYVSGNISIATGISMTSANSSINLVTSGPVSDHASFVPAYPTTKNATGTDAGSVMTTSALTNTTLPKTNITETSTTGSKLFRLSNTRDVSSITKGPAPAEASSETVDVQPFPSQLSTSTTTLTKETTVTQLLTFTCTIGQPCSFRSYNGTTLTISRTTPCSTAGPTSGSNGPTLNSTLNSSESGTMDTLLTSSTMTRTVTLKSNAGIFAAVTTLTSVTFTPLTSSAVTSTAGSTAITTEALEHATTSNTIIKASFVNSTLIASTSSASSSMFSSAMISTSTMSSSIMSTSTMSTPNVNNSITSTSMANMTMTSATSNSTMSSTFSLLSSSSLIASSIGSSATSLISTIPSSAPTPTGPSSSTVIIIPYTKTVAVSATSLANSGAHASPPRHFAMLLHLFSYLKLASAEFISTTVRTTTFDPIKTVTVTPASLGFPNFGFNNAGVRPSPPFVAAMLANLVPVVHGNAKRGETISSSSTTTVTLTVLKNQEHRTNTAVATSTSTNDMDINFTSAGTSIMSIPPILDFTAAGTSIMSIPPVPGTSEGMFTSAGSITMSMPMNSSGIIATPLRSSPGSGPTPRISGKPAASGEAGKGVVGGLAALVGGVVLGLL